MIKIRTIIFASLIFLIAIFSISFKVIDIDFLGVNFERGDPETFLGLSLGLDLKGGTHLVYEAQPKTGSELTSDDMEGARRILEKRVNSFGISESSVQLIGSGTNVPSKILVQLPGLQQVNIAMTIAGQTSNKELQELVNNLGYEELKISQLEGFDGRFVASGPRVRRNDGQTDPAVLLAELDKSFPLSMILAYRSEDEENGSIDIPALAQVEAAASLTGEKEFNIEDLSQGVFRITFPSYTPKYGDINYRYLDQSETSILASSFEEIGTLFQASISGGISSWKISGGVEEAKKLIGETAQLEFKERDCLWRRYIARWPQTYCLRHRGS